MAFVRWRPSASRPKVERVKMPELSDGRARAEGRTKSSNLVRWRTELATWRLATRLRDQARFEIAILAAEPDTATRSGTTRQGAQGERAGRSHRLARAPLPPK